MTGRVRHAKASGVPNPADPSLVGGADWDADHTITGLAIGADVQAHDATLDALAAYNTSGLLTQVAPDNFVGRTAVGTANEITVTNGNAVSGNPTWSLPPALNFTSKTVTGGTFASAAVNRVLNVLSYGVVGDGTTNDATALGLAATAVSVAGGTLVFPPGKICSNSSITINIPAGKSVTLEGFATVYFPACHGLIINYGDKYSSFHINGLTLTTGTAGTYHAIRLLKAATDLNPALSGTTTITDVSLRGEDGYAVANYWDTGTYVSNVPNINWTRYNAIGVGGTLGLGIYVSGKVAATSYAIGFGVHASVFEALSTGILIGDYVQGVNVDSMTLFTGCQVGIHTAGGTLGDLEYLSVLGSQFDCTAAAIFLETVVGEVLVSNNLIFPHASAYGILGAMANFSIIGNTFQGGGAGGNTGIEITSGGIGSIGGNPFSGLATGIKLDSGVVKVSVLGTNAYSTVTTPVNNVVGTANTVIRFPEGTTDFTATGGTGQFLKQASAGAPLTVSAIAAGDIASGTLAAARGGFGADVSAAAGVPLFAAGVPTFTGTNGTGNFARTTSPAFVAPVLGAASATSLAASGPLTSAGPTSGVGYATGAGGAVTQITSKATGATLNTVCGAVTMNNAALAAATIVSFVLTNSAIAATDVLILNHISGGTVGAYTLNAQAAAGSATINVRNNTAGSLSEAIVIQFVVIKAVNA